MQYYIFGWKGEPKGGVRDLILTTHNECLALKTADEKSSELDVVQLMDANGNVMTNTHELFILEDALPG